MKSIDSFTNEEEILVKVLRWNKEYSAEKNEGSSWQA